MRGKDTPIGQHISNKQIIWHLSQGDEESIPALKIKILWDMADSIPYLVPTQFQELLLFHITRPKIPVLYCKYKKTMKCSRRGATILKRMHLLLGNILKRPRQCWPSAKDPQNDGCVCVSANGMGDI